MEYFGKTEVAREESEKAEELEKIKLAILASYGEDGKFSSSKFQDEIKNLGGKVLSTEKNKIVVQIGKYDATIDAMTGEILDFGKRDRPKVEINLYQENGEILEQDIIYDKLILTVDVINAEQASDVNEITVIDTNGNSVNPQSNLIGEGIASYRIIDSGVYTITIKAIINGVEKETTIEKQIRTAPEEWRGSKTIPNNWYDYSGAKIEEPKLKGEMIPIRYIGEEQEGNKWANAITKDR